jgi:hypothetical protein
MIVIVNTDNKRIRFANGKLSPQFQYFSQAFKYIDKHGMLYARPLVVE